MIQMYLRHRRTPKLAWIAGLSILTLLAHPALADEKDTWLQSGNTLQNTRNQAKENDINTNNVGQLAPKWETKLTDVGGGDVWTTPAVDKDYVYFPDSAGFLYKLRRSDGGIEWQRPLTDYSVKPTNFSRTTPAISGNTLIIGDQANRFPFYNNFDINQAVGAEVMAVDKRTGKKLWTTVVDDHPFSIITAAATIYNGVVLVGVSSYESAYVAYVFPPAGAPEGTQGLLPLDYSPTSNGSLVALDLNTGEIIWQRFMTTDDFSGASIWGSMPSIDEERGQVFIGTGQNFDMPLDVQMCAQEAFNLHPGNPSAGAEEARDCMSPYPDNHFDSIVALDIQTGEINWSNRVVGYDTWHVACLFGVDFLCPQPAGLDKDFGQAPILFSISDKSASGVISKSERGKRDVIGVGQKSGQYWVFDAEDGELVWMTQVSPGGIAGGIQWGTAYDGKRLYTSSANSDNIPWTLVDGRTATGGIWSALDPATGEILWQTADPNGAKSGGAATVANGVVYVCSWDPAGTLYALDAKTGEILWSFESGGSCNSGAAVAGGEVYWGSGYASGFDPVNTAADYFRAFSVKE